MTANARSGLGCRGVGRTALNADSWGSVHVTDRALHIMQVSTADILGGAESIATTLCRALEADGQQVTMVVGRKHGNDPRTFRIRHHEEGNLWRRFWWRTHYGLQPLHGRIPGARWVLKLAQRLAEPQAVMDALWGREDFHYPGTSRLWALTSPEPDIVHGHNLHGGYFDLGTLPALCRRVPVVLTLHDAWLLSGHCAHSLDCDRWKTGCGSCPDLTLYPAVRRDATAFNWQRKSDIYARSNLYVATPSRWLMEKVEQSMLWRGTAEARVIPNGVDLSIFHPGDKSAIRASMGWSHSASVLLFAANGIRKNSWKDFSTLRDAVARLAQRASGRELLLIALGERGHTERIGPAEIRFVPCERDPSSVARYYQAADVYVHAARVDTFPNSVIEALACGTPVVATAVGGIPEQVTSLTLESGPTGQPTPAPPSVSGRAARLRHG